MKVTVVSGRCNYDCPDNRKPYGVNQPGPTIRYKTIDVKGKNQEKVAYQLSQSAYLPLQLPYNVFGLGQAPNFVDSLQVGIATNTTKQLNHEFQSVIPNSQLVIIPYPIQDPSKWSSKLFVMPSRLMMLTGAALLGACGFIAGIVAILHWRDRVEDRKEKRQEAQKFHFDAIVFDLPTQPYPTLPYPTPIPYPTPPHLTPLHPTPPNPIPTHPKPTSPYPNPPIYFPTYLPKNTHAPT
ncbi:hypothetical protein DPMN_061599 [Dreissena polymorpha]|uniref:T-cell immunomodulatory protein TIP C2 domain-containing protein n=1 Tax=Dreissena polymorpha TaxID=45954 RepID=A0A9D4HH26_DREPO|nr:hypothetical protein DPMN_061599 [Dreissena polymorpha]